MSYKTVTTYFVPKQGDVVIKNISFDEKGNLSPALEHNQEKKYTLLERGTVVITKRFYSADNTIAYEVIVNEAVIPWEEFNQTDLWKTIVGISPWVVAWFEDSTSGLLTDYVVAEDIYASTALKLEELKKFFPSVKLKPEDKLVVFDEFSSRKDARTYLPDYMVVDYNQRGTSVLKTVYDPKKKFTTYVLGKRIV